MRLTELQLQKLTHKFDLLDVDGNDYIELEDFQRVIEVLAEIRELSKDDADYVALEQSNKTLWQNLRDFCDANEDGKISLQEWIDYHSTALFYEREFACMIPGFETTLDAMTTFFFQLLDGDGDGVVSEEDYLEFCEAHGIAGEQARQGFKKMDTNGDGQLSSEELHALVRDFYHSDDPEAPGNWFFGSL